TGTYWLDWAATVTPPGDAANPALVVVGARTKPGWNALRFNGSWTPAMDLGIPLPIAPDVPVDYPFEVYGIWSTTCGDGTVDPGEPCDDGNAIDGDGCDSNCTPTGCGNAIITMGEACDDGNTINGDGCSSSCTVEGPVGAGGAGGACSAGSTAGAG